MVEKINVKSHTRKTTSGSTKVEAHTRLVDSETKEAMKKLKEKEAMDNIVKGGDIYNNKSTIGMLKENVTKLSDKPFYFDKSNVSFFNSKVKSVYANNRNNRFVFLEEATDPSGRLKSKIGEYNYKNRELQLTSLSDNNAQVRENFNKIRQGKAIIDDFQ